MKILKIKNTGALKLHDDYINIDKIVRFFFDGENTQIHSVDGSYVFVEGDVCSELTKILIRSSPDGNTYSLNSRDI